MAFVVTASAPTAWPLYTYLKSIVAAAPINGVDLTSVTLDNDAAGTGFDRRITLTGTGIDTNGSGVITDGNVTGIKIAGLTGSPTYFTFTVSHPLSASALFSAVQTFITSGYTNTAPLDALFDTESYTFNGGTGDDLFEGGAKADTLNGNGGDDALYGNGDNDTINGGAGDDILDGGDGDDIINGGTGEDWITTGVGKNVVNGGAGADTIFFQGSEDTLTFATAATAVSVDLAQGVGLLGEALDDQYFGTGLSKVIGSKANDTLLGSSKSETLQGGLGNDLLMGRLGGDTLDGDLGIDTASYAESPSFGGVGVIVDLTLAMQVSPGHASGDKLTGIENLIGSDYGDELAGDGNANLLDGGKGDDYLEGRGGADKLIGGDGTDRARYYASTAGIVVNLGLKTAQVSGGDANGDILSGIEHVDGTNYADTLIGDGESNILAGGGGDDVLFGGNSTDFSTNTLYGSADTDTADYSKANSGVSGTTTSSVSWGKVVDILDSIENLKGSAFKDNLNGDTGVNKIEGGGGNDLINGNGGADKLYGGAGNDTIYGFGEAEELFGDDGKDTLDSAGGNDFMTGGTGRDRLVYGPGYGTDTVLDFKAGAGGDYIDLRQWALASVGDAFGYLDQVGANAELDFGGGDKLILNNTLVEKITAINFIIK